MSNYLGILFIFVYENANLLCESGMIAAGIRPEPRSSTPRLQSPPWRMARANWQPSRFILCWYFLVFTL